MDDKDGVKQLAEALASAVMRSLREDLGLDGDACVVCGGDFGVGTFEQWRGLCAGCRAEGIE